MNQAAADAAADELYFSYRLNKLLTTICGENEAPMGKSFFGKSRESKLILTYTIICQYRNRRLYIESKLVKTLSLEWI